MNSQQCLNVVGVLLAGGEGRRFDAPYPKVLAKVSDTSLLVANALLLLERFFVNSLFVAVPKNDVILREELRTSGILAETLEIEAPETGIAHGLSQFEPRLLSADWAITVLADQAYFGVKVDGLREILQLSEIHAAVGVARRTQWNDVSESFGVQSVNGRVTHIVEKPSRMHFSDQLGCGIYAFRRELLPFFRDNPKNPKTGRSEIGDAMQRAIDGGCLVAAVDLEGSYINVNRTSDLEIARRLARSYVDNRGS